MRKLTFPVLGAVSSVEIMEEGNAERELDRLRDYIDKELMPALQKTPYVAKSRMRKSIDRSLADARVLCNFPELLNKPLIGIVPVDSSASSLLASLGEESGLWNRETGLPRLLTNAEGKPAVKALSFLGKPVSFASVPDHPENAPLEMSSEELDTLIELEKDNIRPRSICSALHCSVPLKRKDLSFLVLPQEEFGQPESGRLLAQCDALLILGQMRNGLALKIIRDHFNMPVFFLANSDVSEEINYLRSRYAGRQVDNFVPAVFEKLLDSLALPVDRVTLRDRLMADFLDVEEDLSNRISRRRELLNNIKRDSALFAGGGDELDDIFESLRKSLNQEINILKDQKENFAAAAKNVLEAAREVEKLIRVTPKPDHARLSSGVMRPGSLWRRIILRSLVVGYMGQAEEFQARFEAIYPEQAFLTRMYIEQRRGNRPGKGQIEQLRNLPDSPEALRAKIFFRGELGLSEEDCTRIAAILPRPKSADEKYYFALHQYERYQKGKKSGVRDGVSFDTVLQAFQEAVLAGSHDAADMFAKYCGGEGRHDEAREIADMGYPTGAWIYRLLSLTRKDAVSAGRYLKLAAALGYPRAIETVADDAWKKRILGEKPGFDFKNGMLTGLDEENIKAAVRIYETVAQNRDLNVANVNERLAYFYFANRQWRQCREVLGSNPSTTEGAFCRAVMLKYGHGGNQNKNDAIALIRAAEEGSGPFANFAKYVKSKWYEDDLAKI